MPATAAAPAQPQAGSLYGVPGLTLLTEQPDQNDGINTVLSSSQNVNVIGLQQFNQVDIVYWWELQVSTTMAFAVGGGAATVSAYAPWNMIGESRLRIQNQYSNWHPLSGIDAMIWQLIRPMRQTDQRNNMGYNAAGQWDTTTANSGTALPAGAATALDVGPRFTTASTSVIFTLEVPASLHMDMYFDLAADGTVMAPPHRAIVSPQYMAGAARSIMPSISLNAGIGSGLDTAPIQVTGGAPTFTGNTTLGVRRVGCYSSNNVAALPVVYNWQYGRDATQFTLAGRQQTDIQIPTYGQIMSLFLRLWDPAANSGKGAPIALSNVTKCELRFGSGLQRFQDTPRAVEHRFLAQHGFRLPAGVLCWDLGLDEFGRVSNAYALNTLTTSGVLIHLEFSAAQSSTAYAVLGAEFLNYVM